MDVPVAHNTLMSCRSCVCVYLLSVVTVGLSHTKGETTAHITYTQRTRQTHVKQLTTRTTSEVEDGLQRNLTA